MSEKDVESGADAGNQKEEEEESLLPDWVSAKNWTMAGFIPSFVAFTAALQEWIQYYLPDIKASTVTMAVNGMPNSTTFATFEIQTTDALRVGAAWSLFVGLFLLGVINAIVVLYAYSEYHQWPRLASHPYAHLSNTERVQKMQRERMRIARMEDDEFSKIF
jgi:hypothetical protein